MTIKEVERHINKSAWAPLACVVADKSTTNKGRERKDEASRHQGAIAGYTRGVYFLS